MSILSILLFATLLNAQTDRYLIPKTTGGSPSEAEQEAITAAACDGKAEGTHCDTCPEGGESHGIGWTLGRVTLGHFAAAQSEDAFIEISGCEVLHASVGGGFFLRKQDTEWTVVDGYTIGLDVSNCRRMQFRDGRELLLCEDRDMASFTVAHIIYVVSVEGETAHMKPLLIAADTTRYCAPQEKAQKATIDRLSIRNSGNNGAEISFVASIGTIAMTDELVKRCTAGRPVLPKISRSYRIDYVFNGETFRLKPTSEAAAKLFHWEF